MELQRGMFAQSLAGHDKGHWYIVVEADEKEVWLCDGRIRSVEKPKKKNRRHVQPDYRDSGVFTNKSAVPAAEQDAAIRSALRSKEESACQKQM